MTSAATLHVAGHERTAIAALTDAGFVVGRPRTVTTALLDTFDGRLHRAGLRLQMNHAEQIELELSGAGTPPAHVTVDAVPQMSDDIPSGPFRARVASLVDGRALLARLRITERRTDAVLRDAAGKLVAVAELHEDVRIVDRPDVDPLAATIEIRAVPGYTKHADRTVESLRRAGLEGCATDTMTLCAKAADIDLAGFSASPTVALDPTMAAIDGYRLVLANLADTITANWQGVIERTDPEFLHDMRIAMRRTRVVLANSTRVLPAETLEHARHEMAWLASLTGPPRDLDVFLMEWSNDTVGLGPEAAAMLVPVRDVIEHRWNEVHTELRRAMLSERAEALMTSWQAWLSAAPPGDALPKRAGRPLGDVVAERITRAHRHLLERGRSIGPDTPAVQLHDLRKDAKKLRYLVECFGSLLPRRVRQRYVKRLKVLLDNLGEHQDAAVHVDMLRAVVTELRDAEAPADTMVAIGRLMERLDQQRRAARTEFAERFSDYDTRSTRRAFDTLLDGLAS